MKCGFGVNGPNHSEDENCEAMRREVDGYSQLEATRYFCGDGKSTKAETIKAKFGYGGACKKYLKDTAHLQDGGLTAIVTPTVIVNQGQEKPTEPTGPSAEDIMDNETREKPRME